MCVVGSILIKLLPGVTTLQNASFKKKVELWSPVIHLQLLDASPDIIIFGNTWDMPYHEYPYSDDSSTLKNSNFALVS